MSCEKRIRTGFCTHDQCPYPNVSGCNCVSIVNGYCDDGDDCHAECPYSWDAYKGLSPVAAEITLDRNGSLVYVDRNGQKDWIDYRDVEGWEC